jgi:AcrR family transcriptional regulator
VDARATELSRFPRVPPGRHGLPREVVAGHQRRRILAAMAELSAKRGYRDVPMRRLCTAAGIASTTFYEHFADKEEAFLATFDDGVEQAQTRMAETIDPTSPWEEQIRDGLAAVLELAAEEPALASTCLVEALSAGPAAIEHYEAAVNSLVPVFRRGRESRPATKERPATLAVEETVIRGLAWTVNQRLVMNKPVAVDEMLPEMLEFALAPYIGDDEARRIAASPAAPSRTPAS